MVFILLLLVVIEGPIMKGTSYTFYFLVMHIFILCWFVLHGHPQLKMTIISSCTTIVDFGGFRVKGLNVLCEYVHRRLANTDTWSEVQLSFCLHCPWRTTDFSSPDQWNALFAAVRIFLPHLEVWNRWKKCRFLEMKIHLKIEHRNPCSQTFLLQDKKQCQFCRTKINTTSGTRTELCGPETEQM